MFRCHRHAFVKSCARVRHSQRWTKRRCCSNQNWNLIRDSYTSARLHTLTSAYTCPSHLIFVSHLSRHVPAPTHPSHLPLPLFENLCKDFLKASQNHHLFSSAIWETLWLKCWINIKLYLLFSFRLLFLLFAVSLPGRCVRFIPP